MSEDAGEETLDLPPSLRDGKVVEGRGGRLFLANDANRVLDQHRGALRFSEDQLRQWRLLLETRRAWLAERGARHYFLIAPNAHSVYADDLPEGISTAPQRPIDQLLAHLAAHGAGAGVVYPLEALVAHRDAHAYAKTGSHWTGLGAFLAAQALLEVIAADLPVRVPSLEELEIHELTYIGDLGAKLRPQGVSTFVRVRPRAPRAKLIEDNRVRNTGRRIDYVSADDAARLDCLVYGDSFAVRVLPFLAESFRRVTFAHMPNLDFDLVAELRPDVVVKIMCERFMIVVPVDLPGRTQAAIAAEKLAAGDLLPPRRRPPQPGRPVSLSELRAPAGAGRAREPRA